MTQSRDYNKFFMAPKRSPTGWERLALIGIVVIAFWLRFRYFLDIEWNIDQAYPVWQALRTLDNGELPLLGQGTSVLFANPPLTGYIFLPVMALTRLALSAMLLTVTLNSFGVFLVYRGLRWLIGTRPALLGAALVAINPWMIEESRRTWVQSFEPFFVPLIFWLIVPVLTQQTRHPKRRLVAALIALTLAANTYLLGYLLCGTLGILFLLYWKRLPKQALWSGAAIFLMVLGLYGYGLFDNRNDTRYQVEEFGSAGQAYFSTDAFNHAVRLVTANQFANARGQNAPIQDWQTRADLGGVIHWIWFIGLIFGIGRAGYHLFRRDSCQEIAIIMLVWFFFPIMALTYVSNQVHLHYMMFTVPAGVGLVAWGLTPLLQRPSTLIPVLVLVGFSGVVNGIDSFRYAQASAAHPTENYPVINLGHTQQVGLTVREIRTHHETLYSTIDDWVLWGGYGELVDVIEVDTTTFEIVPPQGAIIIRHELPTETYRPPLHATQASEPLELADNTRFTYWHLSQDFQIPHATAIPSDIGLSFVGWQSSGELEAGRTIEIVTYWRVDELQVERFGWTFVPFIHVFDSSGQRIYNGDGAFVSPFIWHQSDIIIQHMALTLAADTAGPYSIVTGIFDGQRSVNAIFRTPREDGTLDFTATIPLTVTE